MPTLNIDGVGRIKVDDNFLRLSPEQQNATVEEITRSIKGQQVSTAEDVVKSAAIGIPKGALNLATIPNALDRGLLGVVDWASEKLTGRPVGVSAMAMPSTATMQKGIEGVTGPWYEPKTGAGKIAQAAVDTGVQTLLGGAGATGLVRNAMMGIASGAGSEAAGQATEGKWYEPIARIAAGMGLPLAMAAPGMLRGTPSRIAGDALKGTTKQQMDQAQALMDDAARMGSPITGAEAIAQVTGRNRLQDVQRVVEQSRTGAPVMQQFYAGRPEANARAFANAADNIAPSPVGTAREMVGQKAQDAATGAIKAAENARTAKSSPFFQQLERETVDDALVAQVVKRIDDALTNAPPARGTPARKALEDLRLGLTTDQGLVTNAGTLNSLRKTWRDKLSLPEISADAVPKEAAAVVRPILDELKDALSSKASFREGNRVFQNMTPLVDELTEGTVGRIAQSPKFAQQVQALFSRDPDTVDAATVGKALGSMKMIDAQATKDVVRVYLDNAFQKATRDLVSGQNEFGAAKFKALVAGNDQQAKNLQAAIRTATGDMKAVDGFKRLMDVFEAQGKRMPVGSQTEFNRQLAEELSGGMAAATGLTRGPLTTLQNWWDNVRYGGNTKALAELLTDPKAVKKMQSLALLKPDSEKARLLATEIISGAEAIRREDRLPRQAF